MGKGTLRVALKRHSLFIHDIYLLSRYVCNAYILHEYELHGSAVAGELDNAFSDTHFIGIVIVLVIFSKSFSFMLILYLLHGAQHYLKS